jgi:hypothetical protein
MRCTGGYKRVRSRFGGTVRRCRSFGGRKSSSRRRSRPKGRGMAKRGSHCLKRKRVYSRALGKRVWRCADYGRGSGRARSSSRARSRYRRGRRPYNKGKKCRAMGTNRAGKPVCRSYGSTSGWRSRRGRGRHAGTALIGRGMFPQRRPAAPESGIPFFMRGG